jgi:hypothetical protein
MTLFVIFNIEITGRTSFRREKKEQLFFYLMTFNYQHIARCVTLQS